MRVQRSPFRWPSKAIRTWSQQRGAIRQVETSYTDLRGVALMTHTRLTLDKGIVGSILVLLWSRSLIKQTTSILIDSGAQDETSETLRGKIKHLVTDISDIQDLRIWRTSNSHYACIIKIQGNADTNVRDHITLALSKLPISYAAIDIDEKVKHQKNSDLQN